MNIIRIDVHRYSSSELALCQQLCERGGTGERSDFLSKIVHFISAATGAAAAAAAGGYGGSESWLLTEINNGTRRGAGRFVLKPKKKPQKQGEKTEKKRKDKSVPHVSVLIFGLEI